MEKTVVMLKRSLGFLYGIASYAVFFVTYLYAIGFVGKPYTNVGFRKPGPYKLVRHPLYVGWLFAFSATPVMTLTHFVFALATTAYILISMQLEEHDLIQSLGQAYREYKKEVPALIPFARRRVARANADTVCAER